MNAVIERYTYEDYKNWEGDWELIDGFPIAMAPSPMRIHQNIVTEIIFELKRELEEKDCEDCEVLNEMDYKINNETIVRPDIVLTCDETNDYHLTIAPKIIVEIISKSTARIDEKIKFELYESEKVKCYIIIYPDDLRAKVYELKDSKYDKVADFTDERYTFRDEKCEVSIDFKRVFKRYRK